jgi:hypothetical protein
MRTYLILLLSIITLSVMSCNSSYTIDAAENIEVHELSSINPSNEDIEKDYDNLYFYQSAARDIDQSLYIKYDSKDKSQLYFKLIIVRENCEYEIAGVAKTSTSSDAEIDKDSEGNAYMTIEYQFKNKEHFLAIRISENKEMSKISYVRNDGGKEKCAFMKNELMYSE